MRFPVKFAVGLCVAAIVVVLVSLEYQRLRLRQANSSKTEKKSDAPHYDCAEDRPRTGKPSESGALIDITESVGISFTPATGPLGTYFMPESTGAGAAFLDYDNDGRLDIYFVNCGQSPKASQPLPSDVRIENRLYRQTEAGIFTDVTAESGLGDTEYGSGVAVGDIDNDGLPDVFLANYGQDRLYRNRGNGTFEDITELAGFRESEWGTCVAMFDYDRDGWLDLMVVNYTADPTYQHSVACGFQHGTVSYCGPHKFQPTIDRLYHNEGLQPDGTGRQNVRFRDVTEEAGLHQAATYGFGVICADLTEDGWPDIFVANDGASNRLWVNQKNGSFLEEAVQRGVAVNKNGTAEAGMGVALGDVNHDLKPDIVVSHLTKETMTLYQNAGQGLFIDQTQGSGIDSGTMPHTGWGTALIDLDLDGWLDLPVVNGLVIPCHSGFPFHGEDIFQVRTEIIRDTMEFWKPYADDNVLMMGRPDGTFVVNPELGGDFSGVPASGRGLVYGDFDEDGDHDLLVTNCGTSARLYRNDLPRKGNWLAVRPVLTENGRDALGARIIVRSGSRSLVHVVNPHSSYLASHDPRARFGLGNIDHTDDIVVYWPDGPVEESGELFPGGPVNRVVTLVRGGGQKLPEQTQ